MAEPKTEKTEKQKTVKCILRSPTQVGGDLPVRVGNDSETTHYPQGVATDVKEHHVEILKHSGVEVEVVK